VQRYANDIKTASPLHYIFQAAMGQCSTLPADKNGKSDNSQSPMSPATHSSRRSYKQQREERDSYHEGDYRRQSDGDVVMGEQPSRTSRSDVRQMVQVAKDQNAKFAEPFGEEQDNTSHYHSTSSSKSSSRGKRGASSSRVTPSTREDFFPPPPEGAVRTRCYRLNLDVPAVLSPTHDSLGPFHYTAPVHLLSNYGEINESMSTESVEKSNTQIAVDTARIFRGIKVDNNGTIVGRNDRASRSRRGQNSSKTAENSRQSAKINKANDLVDEMVASGKENGNEKASMISIIPIGEYDDMKQLVRDGSKKLREAEFKGDEAILSQNRFRGTPRSRKGSSYPASPNSISRRKLSPSSPQYNQDMPSTPRSTSSASRSKSKSRRSPSGSAPPKLKGHPRDRPTSRRMDTRSDERNHQKCNTSLFGGGDGDWSEALNFNSIWNCGGTGTGTMSPSNNGGTPTNARSTNNKIRYEGRNESNTRFSRGVSERDAPLIL
jgi:hypothetical protein